ncbi:MAG: HNH endonuclease, partial [Caulobacteraceae bacterium]|nr:HNH endonuclease [Caulobacteraceae bacterium]
VVLVTDSSTDNASIGFTILAVVADERPYMHEFIQKLSNEIDSLETALNEAWKKDSYKQIQYLTDVQKSKKEEKEYLLHWLYDPFVYQWFQSPDAADKLELLLEYGLVSFNGYKSNRQVYKSQNKQTLMNPNGREQRFWVYWRDNSTCVYCQKHLSKEDSQVDHVIPQSAWHKEFLWLANDASNLVACCKKCNQIKTNTLMLPKSKVMPLIISGCMPKQKITDEVCGEADSDNCPVCNSKLVSVFCNVHGAQTMQICKIAAYKKFIGDQHGL